MLTVFRYDNSRDNEGEEVEVMNKFDFLKLLYKIVFCTLWIRN